MEISGVKLHTSHLPASILNVRDHVLEVRAKDMNKLMLLHENVNRLPSDLETLLTNVGLIVDNDEELVLSGRDGN